MEMNSRTHVRLIIVSAALCLAVTTVFAQNPPPAPPAAGAAAPQQGRGAAVGQIPIPQPCTPEQIAAAQAPRRAVKPPLGEAAAVAAAAARPATCPIRAKA